MGPGENSLLPQRPKFSWDVRNAPWTDGIGNQEGYAESVKLWKTYHDSLVPTNSTKIPAALQGIVLQSQLFGRAKDTVRKLAASEIASETGATKIVNALHKRDALQVVSEVFQDFISLLNFKRKGAESFKEFEQQFEALSAKFNSHSDETKLPEALLAFMMMANANLDSNQKISVLAASTPKNSDLTDTSTTTQFLSAVSYDSIASVIRQCEPSKSSIEEALSVNAASTETRPRRRTLTPVQLADLKSKSQCRKCNDWGHWHNDHLPDGTLKPGVKSRKTREISDDNNGRRRTVTFNMATFPNMEVLLDGRIGPLCDDGAPYCGIGLIEFNLIQPYVAPEFKGTFEELPESIRSRPFWQYGDGKHKSAAKAIVGSIMFTALSDQGNYIRMRHLIIEGSSQWLIGRNVTKSCDILHIGKNLLKLPDDDTISLVDKDLHSFIPYNTFCGKRRVLCESDKSTIFCATAIVSCSEESRPWIETKKIVDKVHTHVCGHSNFSDIKILLERNSIWDESVEKYLVQIMESCISCRTTALPKPSRKVSLSSMSRQFNDVVCVDHFFLDNLCIFHAMDAITRYSAGSCVPDTSMVHSILSFETLWISQFWIPSAILFDRAFKNTQFDDWMKNYGIDSNPIPPRRHNKNVLESKHRIIRDIFIRLKSANESNIQPEFLVQQSLRISNDLYGNDVVSAYELAKGFTRPILKGQGIMQIPVEIVDAQETLKAKRKLALIMRSKSTRDNVVKPGDEVEVYLRKGKEKRGKWLSGRPILSYDHESRTVSIPGSNGRTMSAAIEDVRPAVEKDSFAQKVRESIDILEENICLFSEDLNENDNAIASKNGSSSGTVYPELLADTFTENHSPNVGDRIEVLWPLEGEYFPGKIMKYNEDSGTHHVKYDDNDEETLNLSTETWKAIETNQVSLKELKSLSAEATEKYFNNFGYKTFLLHETQGLPGYVIDNAYSKQEESFMEQVRSVPIGKVPRNANVISSHVIYKVKLNDDGTKEIKARIAPHGNKDRDRFNLKTDSASCSPVGVRILLSCSTLFKWKLAKIDFSSAFLQSGEAQRDVYVVPPKECSTRSRFYWLLLSAAYGLVNASAKWQEELDGFFLSIGFTQSIFVPQLFFKKDNNGEKLEILAVKIVDDVLFGGETNVVEPIIDAVKHRYTLGTIVFGPGTFLFNGLQIRQYEDFTISIDGDSKLDGIEGYPIDRNRRRQISEPVNAIEKSSYSSVNGSLVWIGIAASPFCAFTSSYLQQRAPKATVQDLVAQINMLKQLKKYGTMTTYKRPEDKHSYELSILIFSDASKTADAAQLGHVSGLLIGPFKKDAIFHGLHWTSNKSKRPVRSTGSAEILAAGYGIDEGKILRNAYEELLDVKVNLISAVDSKDLWTTLSTCRVSNRIVLYQILYSYYCFLGRSQYLLTKLKFVTAVLLQDNSHTQKEDVCES